MAHPQGSGFALPSAQEFILCFLVLALVVILLVPVPTFVLDAIITLNISIGIVLLITTFGLNIAARQILKKYRMHA